MLTIHKRRSLALASLHPNGVIRCLRESTAQRPEDAPTPPAATILMWEVSLAVSLSASALRL